MNYLSQQDLFLTQSQNDLNGTNSQQDLFLTQSPASPLSTATHTHTPDLYQYSQKKSESERSFIVISDSESDCVFEDYPVPGFPEWFNIKYAGDRAIYTYELMVDYKRGDLKLLF